MSRPCINSNLGCQGEIDDGSVVEECRNCKSAFYRWRKRRPNDIKERHQKLQLYDHRLIPLLPDDDDEKKKPRAKVTQLQARRRA